MKSPIFATAAFALLTAVQSVVSEETPASIVSLGEFDVVASDYADIDADAELVPEELDEDEEEEETQKSKDKKTKKSKKSEKKSKKSKKCLDEEKTSVERDGKEYKIELEEKDAKCTDKDDRTYQYGEFKDVKTFSECAEKCVEDVKKKMLDSFRGIDFKCKDEICKCLYDEDALDDAGSEARDRYDKTSRDQDGDGKVKNTKKDSGTYCGKLTSSSSVDFAEDEVAEHFTRKGLCGLNMDEDDEDLCEHIKSDYCGEGRTDVHFTMRNFCHYVGFDNVALAGAAGTSQTVSVTDMYDMVVDDIEEELDQ